MPEFRIEVDFHGLEELDRQLSEAIQEEEIKALQEQILLEIGNRLMMLTKEKTPVDTGDLRGNWFLSDLAWNGDTLELELYNNTEYAPYVEYGHAQEVGRYVPAIGKRLVVPLVPGFFMMTRSEEEIKGVIPDLVKARVEAYLREVLG